MAELRELLTDLGYEQFKSIRNDSTSWYEKRILDDVSAIRDAIGIGDEPGRLLDVGCGPGWLTIGMSFMTNLDFVCVDLSERAIERAKANIFDFYRGDRVRAMRADAHDLPFDDESFDYVTTTSSIGFWHNPQRGIEELYRVLKPGGRIFIRGFDGNRYTDFWHTIAETGIPEYKFVRDEHMSYILIWKDRDHGLEEGCRVKSEDYRFDSQLALERHEADWIEKTQPYAERVLGLLGVGPDDTGTVLDVGSGRGGMDVCMALVSDLSFVCIDLSEDGLRFARESAQKCGISARMKCQQADAMGLPFANECFDYVMSTMSIGGWRNAQRGLQEAYRVLKSGGRLFVNGFNSPLQDYWKKMLDAGFGEFYMAKQWDMTFFVIQKR